MKAFLQSVRSLGPMRLAAMAGIGIGILAFFIYIMARVSSPQMELLYGNLDLADSGRIVERLEAERAPYQLRRDGTEIWVPADLKNQLRVKMAEASLPAGGAPSLGYEVFDNADTFGSTSFMQNVNLVRALEGELARTIRSIDRVRNVRVHLVMPKRELFSREEQEPSASIVLQMEGGARLNRQQVEAIQHMVAASVPKLKPHRISIVDDRGTLLARGYENQQDMLAHSSEEMRLAYESRLARTIEQLLERSVGVGNVRAEVSAEMDFNRVATTEEIFDPDSRVVRSEVTINENEQSEDTEGNPVTVQQNLPDVNAAFNSSGRSSSSANRTQETVNYEISKTVRNHVKELGEVRRLSVAVLVNGRMITNAEGQRVYEPLSQQQLDQLSSLVRSTIGFDGNRGDMVEVVNMQFADFEDMFAEIDDNKIFGMDRDFLEKVASNLGLSIVAILFLLLVLRPLVSRAVESMSQPVGPDGRRLLTDQTTGAPALTGPGGALAPVPGMGLDEMEMDELIDIEKVEGRVKASSMRKIGEIVDKHPEEALSIIRNWLYQEN
ncbi:flagellar basal-body MS-ring/collar protein FliF [Telmatospirillum sp. J64-1]|uniref:flagellar basal-body MS-ring/collar protein FliF n=1 Tax=Telmatospirillum sp. J64-1 TaxID=2502183 RepID=UPI00163DB149|nr:flagellar basal-body MS-ring/collar protein FliF [Telmatospirillum sp. J64-1]